MVFQNHVQLNPNAVRLRMSNSTISRRRFLMTGAATLLSGWGIPAMVSAAAVPEGSSRAAVIIDDIGYSRRRADRFLRIPAPLSFSVLPRLALSEPLVQRIADHGRDVMLHQPMEPLNGHIRPGPGAIYVADDETTIHRVVSENLRRTPGVIGVNNHMGSRLTACGEKIRPALEVVKNAGLFFVDSLTSPHSVAYATARRLKIESARRHEFLDDRRDVAAIGRQLRLLDRIASRYGAAVGIGHPFPETAEALDRYVAAAHRVRLVPITELLNG